MLEIRLRYCVRSWYRPPAMPEPSPSVPVSTRSMDSDPPCSCAASLPGRSGALAVLVFTLLMMSGCCLVKSLSIGCVNWRFPATSTMFSVTGLDGLSGTSEDGPAEAPPPPPLLGAVQAAASAAAESAASRPVPRRNRWLRGSPIEGTPLSGSGRRASGRRRVAVGTGGTGGGCRRAHDEVGGQFAVRARTVVTAVDAGEQEVDDRPTTRLHRHGDRGQRRSAHRSI